jgi:DNA polymerase III delta subunit
MKLTPILRKRRKAARRRLRKERKHVQFLTLGEARFQYPEQAEALLKAIREKGVDERSVQMWVDDTGLHLSTFVDLTKTLVQDDTG